jgi:hypothetical protein
MKRVILATLAIFFVIGGIAAQEVKIGNGTLTIGGKISTGIEAKFDDSSDAAEKGVVRMHNETDGTNLRAELTTSYVNNNVGFTARLRADDVEVGKAAAGFRYAFGWIDLFDGKLRPVGGLLDVNSNVWGTKGDLDVDVGGAGLRFEIKPIEGLNFGAFLRVPDQAVDVNQTGAWHDDVETRKDPTGATIKDEKDPTKDAAFKKDTTIEQFLRSTALGLAYDHSAFYVRLQYLIDAAPRDIKAGTAEDIDGDAQFDFGVGFTGLSALEAHAEGRIEKLDDFSLDKAKGTGGGKADFRETVGYTISDALPLTVGLNAREVLYGNEDLDSWLQLNPWVSYALSGALSVGLGGGYGFGNHPDNKATDPKVESYIYVKPNLSYSFGNGLATKLWYNFEITKPDAPGVDPVNASTIQLEFVYSF